MLHHIGKHAENMSTFKGFCPLLNNPEPKFCPGFISIFCDIDVFDCNLTEMFTKREEITSIHRTKTFKKSR